MPCEGLPPRHDDPEPKLDIGAYCIKSLGRCAKGCLQISKGVVFVRGAGVDSSDKRECVNGVKMYCQQVWTKGSYLAECVIQPFCRGCGSVSPD